VKIAVTIATQPEKKYKKQNKRYNAGGPGVLRLIFAGYVPLVSQNPYPIIVYSVANLQTPY